VKHKENDQVVSFRLMRSANGTFQISKREAMNRTKHMIAFDKGLDWDDVAVGKNLEDDLGYSREEKRDLGELIGNVFFGDVQIDVDSNELEEAATVRDLYEMIWHHYGRVGTRSIKGIRKITAAETMQRTKRMIARQKNLDENDVTVGKNMKEDLMYSKKDLEVLAHLAKSSYFKGLIAVGKTCYFGNAGTVGDVIDIIWDNCIDEKYKI